jgi:hypothetical protein
MAGPALSEQDYRAFWADGYVVKPGWFDAEEVDLLRRAVELDESIQANLFAVRNSQGGAVTLCLWNHPGDDLFGAFARCERSAGGAERLLGGEVYHYHSKLTMKRPGGGGAWDWHQDYGYWYQNGCLFPDLLSVAIAVDPATRANGCLEFLKGSHKLGRIEHGRSGGQTGAEMERVEQAMKVLDRVHIEMAPGDACFFHCNTLHASAANTTDRSRNLLLCCYNKASNDPVLEHHHPRYTPLAKLPDSAIKAIGLKLDPAARAYMDVKEDGTTVAEANS